MGPFMCRSAKILFTYVNTPRAKRCHRQTRVLSVTYYEHAMSSRPLHVRVTECSLCTCALHYSKDIIFLPLYSGAC
jgi:hypothetical protein